MGDRSKLPKWAAQEMERRERDVAYWEERATAGPDDSDTFARNVSGNDTPLGQERTIRFQVGPEWWQYIDVRKQDNSVIIHANAMVNIHPSASNAFNVTLVERS